MCPFETNCVNLDEISNTLEGQKYLILPRDIYLSESLENISCLTRIVDVYDDNDSEEVILFFGRNNKINLLYTTSIIFIYILRNLLIKVEKYEDEVTDLQNTLDNVQKTIVDSQMHLKSLDERGVFESDDEVGQFFKSMQKIQKELDRYMLPENYGKEEIQS